MYITVMLNKAGKHCTITMIMMFQFQNLRLNHSVCLFQIMFLRTADGNSVSTATKSATVTGSTIEGGQMSSKVKTQLTKVNKYVIRPQTILLNPFFFSGKQSRHKPIEASFKSCLMLSCTIFKIQKNVVGGSETMYVRVLNDINETYRG